MSDVTTEMILRVYDDSRSAEGAYIQIGPCPDVPENLIIHTVDETSHEWFGRIRVSASKEYMRALGKALIRAAEEG